RKVSCFRSMLSRCERTQIVERSAGADVEVTAADAAVIVTAVTVHQTAQTAESVLNFAVNLLNVALTDKTEAGARPLTTQLRVSVINFLEVNSQMAAVLFVMSGFMQVMGSVVQCARS